MASAATLTAVAAVLTTCTPARAVLSHRPDIATPSAIASVTDLQGVSAVSKTDAWAAGFYEENGSTGEPLVLHWNGTSWKPVKSSTPSGTQTAILYGVSAVSATDGWAVGLYASGGGAEPLILNCNGTACKPVPSPLPSGAAGGELNSVSAVSKTDAWAAGYYQNSSGEHVPLLLHWNGTAWKAVPPPSGAPITNLYGVSADSPTDAWAGGGFYAGTGVDAKLILHCQGTACSWVKSSTPSDVTSTTLQGVSAVSPTDAWTVGRYTNTSGVNKPLILRCNGPACKPVKNSAPGGAQAAGLFGVSAVSATDAWAVGTYKNSSGATKPLILRCTGTTCKPVSSSAPSGALAPSLNAVSADSGEEAWAVGLYEPGKGAAQEKSLILRWNGTAWKPVPSPDGP